jgi:hypothetical protein
MAAVVSSFRIQQRTYLQQESLVAAEQNLRVAMGTVKDHLRTSGYGLPGQLNNWIDWTDFTRNPEVYGSEISVAYCSPEPVAFLREDAAAGDTLLAVAPVSDDQPVSDELDTGAKSLVMIDGRDAAKVTTAGDSSIIIDTDINSSGSQGVSKSYPAGTPICRVDVYRFYLDASQYGDPVLVMDNYSETVTVAEGITDMYVARTTSGDYEVMLTAQTRQVSLLTGEYLTRTLSATVPVKN